MSKIFDMENPVMRALSRMADMMILNLVALVLCIPIVTAGASLTAMYYVELKWVRKEEGYLLKPFFQQFKANFKQATGEWLIMLAVGVVLFMDFEMFRSAGDVFPAGLRALVGAVGIILFLLLQWVLPVQCHFINTVRQTLRNSVLLAIANFPRTLGMGAIWVASAVCFILSVIAIPQIFPLVVLFGLTAPGYVVCLLVSKPFKRLEPEKVEKTEEESDEEIEEAYRILTEESAIKREPEEDSGSNHEKTEEKPAE